MGGGLSTITDQYSNLGSKQPQHKAETIFFTVLATIHVLSMLFGLNAPRGQSPLTKNNYAGTFDEGKMFNYSLAQSRMSGLLALIKFRQVDFINR